MELIPEELHSSIKCYVICRGLKALNDSDNDNIDIACCTVNNSILEIRKKQIVTSCKFEAENAVEMQLYYQYLVSKTMKYYLIRTSSKVLVIVQKIDGFLSVLQKFKDVEKFRIFDFNSYGYPQVGIWYTDSMEPYVTEFSASEGEDMAMEVDEPSKSNLITDYLTKQLQELKEHANQLKIESNALQTMLLRTADKSPKMFYETVFPIDEVVDDNVIHKEDISAPLLTITDTWQKVNDEYWLLGINFWNSSKRMLSNVELSLRNSDIRDYVYRIFIPNFKNPDQLFSKAAAWDVFSANSNIPPNREAIIVVKLPEFVDESKHSIKCTLSCESFQCDTSLFELTSQDVVNGKYNLLADSSKTSLGRDLISFLTIDKEVIVDVKIALEMDVSMEGILTKDLHMERLKGFDNENLYVNFGFLKGIVLFCSYVSADPIIWRIYLLTRNTSEVFTFVNALYDVLPTGTVITSKDNS